MRRKQMLQVRTPVCGAGNKKDVIVLCFRALGTVAAAAALCAAVDTASDAGAAVGTTSDAGAAADAGLETTAEDGATGCMTTGG